MTYPHTSPKISIPGTEAVYPRNRLFKWMDSAMARPVIWVSGPPGSGKTTLAANYIKERGLPAVWYRLDEGDADIGSFFHFMTEAAKRAAPKKRTTLPRFSQEYLPGLSIFTRRFFRNFYNKLKPTSIIVFDNYHDVPLYSMFHRMIQHGLSEIPSDIHFLFISREPAPPTFARLLSCGMVEMMDSESLRLKEEELRMVIKLQKGVRLTDEGIRLIQGSLNGWMAGVMLVLEQMRQRGAEISSANLAGAVFDYFAGEVFDKMDKNTQDFFLKTAFLPWVSEDTAKDLTNIPLGSCILSDLHNRHFFVERHGDGMYRYHDLFREFLLSRAAKVFSREHLMQVQQNAAMVLEASGHPEEAVGLFCKAGDWASASSLIIRQASALVSIGRQQTLEGWLRSLPEEVVEKNPRLLYWLGICRMTVNQGESRACLERAFHLFDGEGDAEGVFLSWSAIVATFPHERTDLRRLDRWISLIEELLKRYPRFPSKEIEARTALGISLVLVVRETGQPRTYEWTRRAFLLSQELSDIGLHLNAGFNLTMHNLWTGNFKENEILIEKLKADVISPNAPPLWVLTMKITEAAHSWSTAQYRRCRKVAREGLMLAEKSNVHAWDHLLLAYSAEATIAEGDMKGVDAALKRLSIDIGRLKSYDLLYYHYLSAKCAMIMGDIAMAVSHMEMASETANNLGIPYHEAIWHIGMAQVLLMCGKYDRAKRHLAVAQKIGQHMNSHILEFMCLLSEAQLYTDSGEEDKSIKALAGALAKGREYDYMHSMWCQPEILSCLCAKALEYGIEVEYVKGLIKRRTLNPPAFPCRSNHAKMCLIHENWHWPLKVYTLGKFEIIKDGRPLEFKRKLQKKPLELLKAVIAFGGRDIPEGQLTDALWPDSDGDLAHNAFGVTIVRLRKLIGKDIIKICGGKVSIDVTHCWVDALILDGMIDAVEKAKDITTLTRLTDKILSLYRGALFTGESESWSISFGERLKEGVINTIERVGSLLEQSKKYAQAISYYQKWVIIDDLCELFYQRIMTCLNLLGRPAEAISVYNRCKKVLNSYGMEPSQETEAIRRKLM